MLWTIAMLLLILWLLGMISTYTLGGTSRSERLQTSSPGGLFMNKDQMEGRAKNVAGRIERQAGEWTGDEQKQVRGALKEVEGKLQNAWGNAKDAATRQIDKKTMDTANQPIVDSAEVDSAETATDVRSPKAS